MQKAILTLTVTFFVITSVFSQKVTLAKTLYPYDTTSYYYVSTCEEYKSIFMDYDLYNRDDSCDIDFTKYDLEGRRNGKSVEWKLVHPKKYIELSFLDLPVFNKTEWKVAPYDIMINDSSSYLKLKLNTDAKLKDTFNFNKVALVCNDVWIDCNGSFYYKILYDPIENKIKCLLINLYGGSAGMCPRYDWILINKPTPDTKIVMDECKLK